MAPLHPFSSQDVPLAAQDRSPALPHAVALAQVRRILQLYAQALRGRPLQLHPTAELAVQALPAGDSPVLYVPEYIDTFAEAEANFAAYKVIILRQVGYCECGTLSFSWPVFGQRYPAAWQRLLALGCRPPDAAPSDREGFFAAFPQPELARQLFCILEDARVEAYLRRRYRGIRAALARFAAQRLQQRPPLLQLPWPQVLLEGLLQWTLGGPRGAAWPPPLAPALALLCARAVPLLAQEATVYDTAAAVVDCYGLLHQRPERLAAMGQAALDQVAAGDLDLARLLWQAGDGETRQPALPDDTDPTAGPATGSPEGKTKPEELQQPLRLEALDEALARFPLSPIPPEVLQELLARGEVQIVGLQQGEVGETSGLFLPNLEGRDGAMAAGAPPESRPHPAHAAKEEPLLPQEGTFLYDEWDYLLGGYRRHWCRLVETVLTDEGTAFVQETRQKYADLLARLRRQFQQLRPAERQRRRRLVDGEAIDLDSAVAAVVDRRAGQPFSDHVYVRRERRRRSVAAVFLLDMSASTDDEVPPAPAQEAPTPRPYDFSGFVQDDYYAPPAGPAPRRRVIDVEKETVVLLAETLEVLGDAYAVYGFSGYGRDQVDFFVVKDFAERYDARVQGRIAAIQPQRSTRMGPAIRHATRKLQQQEARTRLLMLLSDGYPQDHDYGKDRTSKEYGIQDTTMALHEARRKGVQTFCITVDPGGHDYLRAMCPDRQYLVIAEVEKLPQALPKIYRGLTI
ncbi:MAG: hypothetical protein KatS3mg131_2509 [Candidatus Tectimicrobiota bacterium]|nr:MAG: hypothetical protein KatS3mg131_2509 [Candidatus Tectomicrobia bacterium]